MSQLQRGKTTLELNGIPYDIQFEISRLIDGWFDLKVWHEGKSATERVPQYSSDPVEDIKSPHGTILLNKILKNEV